MTSLRWALLALANLSFLVVVLRSFGRFQAGAPRAARRTDVVIGGVGVAALVAVLLLQYAV